MTYIATAPLVLVRNQVGQVDYAYEGDVIPWLNADQKKRFLDEGFVAKIGDVEVGPEGVGDPDVDPAAKPLHAATKAAWVDFAVSKGADPVEAEALTKAELVELYGGE